MISQSRILELAYLQACTESGIALNLAMNELNRELADVMHDLKAEPDFKYLQTKRDVIEGEIKPFTVF